MLQNIIRQIKRHYLRDHRAWIVPFSGGKDSTAIVTLVFRSLLELASAERSKEVHIVHNDTLVENPLISRMARSQLHKMRRFAREAALPVRTVITKPKVQDTFWVKMIGRGYPPPNRWFRWCTDRLKIGPTNDYISEKVHNDGEVTIVLGIREDESNARRRSMRTHEEANGFLRSDSLPNACVFAPISTISTSQVWAFLEEKPPPWGGDNHALVDVYHRSSGGSRFGCWVCTVVKRDQSMTRLVESGEHWMRPYLELRDWLKTLTTRTDLRWKVRRNGVRKPGPLKLETRRLLLTRVFLLEQQLAAELISEKEKVAIEGLWHLDRKYLRRERRGYTIPEVSLLEAAAKRKGAKVISA